MLTLPPSPFRRSRRPLKKRSAVPTPAPAGPVLIAATAETGRKAQLTLEFDRAIDVSTMVGSVIVVNDGATTSKTYTATGSLLVLEETGFTVTLEEAGAYAGLGFTLTAGAGNGIAAVNDGATWAGVSGVALPFP